jgi:hypothetical protein
MMPYRLLRSLCQPVPRRRDPDQVRVQERQIRCCKEVTPQRVEPFTASLPHAQTNPVQCLHFSGA